MKRLFYLTESAEFAGQVAKQLMRIPNFSSRHFHVLGADVAALNRIKLQVLSPWLPGAFLCGAKLGVITGAALSATLLEIIALGFGGWGAAGILIAMGCASGAVLGGVTGWLCEHTRIRRFHHDIAAGKILLVVDVRGRNEAPVRKLLSHLPIQPVSEARSRVPVFN